MIGLIITIVILVIIAIWFIGAYNGFVKLRNSCEEAFSTMDVYMKKRYDLIPNLVETVKGYAAHEKETLMGVVEMRNKAASTTDMAEKAEAEGQLTQALKSIFALAEAYPDLKANQNFLDLQAQLKAIEEDIANARKYYNGTVKQFNNKCEMFPSNIVGKIFGFQRKEMFEVSNEEERENVKVEF